MFRRAAEIADKVLKGANLADVPVEQLTKFEFQNCEGARPHSSSVAHGRKLLGAPGLVRSWGLTGSEERWRQGFFSVCP